MQRIRQLLHSTVFKIIALLFMVSFLAIVSMLSTVFLSDSAQSDAEAINVAGSLRKQVYWIASYLQFGSLETELFELKINEFESTLTTGVLVNQQVMSGSSDIVKSRQSIVNSWEEELKPLLTSIHHSKTEINRLALSTINEFVDELELLVVAYQENAESKIDRIRLVLSSALFGTLALIALAMVIVRRHIELPLSNLTAVARKIGQGDFNMRADEQGEGELALLAKTINTMSNRLHRAHNNLEERVKNKTRQLSQSNQSLALLFEISRKMNEVDTHDTDFQQILNKLAKVTGVEDLDLCIMTAQGSGPYEHLVSSNKDLPEKCQLHQCGGCIDHETIFPESAGQLKYQLSIGNENYGVLGVKLGHGHTLDDWHHKLYQATAEQIAAVLNMNYQNEQERRMALMNERSVIARELHDSLAQALSYLKIQVTRLQKLQKKQSSQEEMDQVISELKNGLAAAYSELRELLTTFRLQLDGKGIKSALEQTISNLKNRSDKFEFFLNYQVNSIPFTPQEEINLLQIAREATQNAFYHSQGSRIDISLISSASQEVTLTVKDDGVGIPDDPNKLNHYGLAIMMERSRNLQGELSVKRNNEGGTLVQFRFTPDYARANELKFKSA